MVKLFILVIAVILSFVCPTATLYAQPKDTPEYGEGVKLIKVSRKEMLGYGLSMLFNVYTETYAKCPRGVDDLMIFIDRMDEDSQLVYLNQYDYLRKHKKRLSFKTTIENGDSIVNMYKGKRLALGTSYVGPCKNLSIARIGLFDKQGYFLRGDLIEQRIKDELESIYDKYRQRNKRYDDTPRKGKGYDMIVVEFIHGRLRNLCTNECIDISSSEYYMDINDCLHKIANENNLSRIIISIFVG